MSTHGLELGSLDLASPFEHESGCKFSVLADGASFGSPAAAVKSIVSMLADGDLVTYDRAGNREASFVVQIEAPDGVALAAGEVALRRELYRPNWVKWTPPADFGPATVFEVVMSEMAPTFDDIDELNVRRRFTVTLTCAPWARSVDLVTIAPLESGTTVTVFDTCDSATGWTATTQGNPAVASTAWEAGSVGVAELDDTVPQKPEAWTLTRTGAVDFTSTPYLRVKVHTIASDVGSPMNVTAYAASMPNQAFQLPILSSRRVPGGPFFEVIYDLSGYGSVAALTFRHVSYKGQPWQGIFIGELARTDATPNVTPRQVARILEMGGTERTPASLRVAAPDGTTALGFTILHTSPEDGSGYSPPLRRWRVTGSGVGNTETSDSALLSGKREALHPNVFRAEVPTSSLPEGVYELCARVRSGVVGTKQFYFTGFTRLPAPNNTTLAGEVAYNELINFPVANQWQFVSLGVMTLPTIRTASGTIVVDILADYAAPGTDVQIDEAWLFRVGKDCALTVADIPAPNMWADSASLDHPQPTLWMGSGEMSRAHPGPGLRAMGAHVFDPEGTAVFCATTGVQYPLVTATGYPRWHSNAGA